MTHDQSALLELLAQLQRIDVSDRFRIATETPYQKLVSVKLLRQSDGFFF